MKPVTLTDGQVLQFKYFDPFNKLRGLTPLAPGRLPIEQEVNMSVWNAGFFQGGIRNPIVIMLKQLLGTGANRTNFLEQIRRDYTGFVRGHGPLVLEGGAEARPLLQSIKDLDFIEGKNLTREEICAPFSVPPALVGIFRDANYSNSREQTRLFWLNTLVPKIRLFRNVIQVGLLDKYCPDVYVDFDWSKVDALEADPVQKATAHNLDTSAANNLYNRGYTKEEIAAYIGNDKLIGDGKPKPPPAPPKPPPAAPAPPAGPVPPKNPKRPPGRPAKDVTKALDSETWSFNLTEEFLEEFSENYKESVLDPFAQDYLRFLKTFTKELIEESKDSVEVDHLKWKRQWSTSIEPLISRILYAGAKELMQEVLAPETDPKKFIASEDPGESIDFFSKETSAKSLVITGMLSGIKSDPNAIKLWEVPDAIILSLMSLEEAKWAVSRVFHHGKLLAMVPAGVTEHLWVNGKCPVHPVSQHKSVAVPWTEFPNEVGIHPMSKDTLAPVQACTCTTHPLVVKLSTK